MQAWDVVGGFESQRPVAAAAVPESESESPTAAKATKKRLIASSSGDPAPHPTPAPSVLGSRHTGEGAGPAVLSSALMDAPSRLAAITLLVIFASGCALVGGG